MDDLDLKKLNAMLGIPSSKLTNEDSEDEDQLEDELNAILSGQAGGRAKKPPTKSLINQMNQLNLDKIMQDNENDQLSDDEPIDENDPQLLAELSRYVPSASKQPKPEQPPVRVEPKTIIPNPAPSPKSTSATTCLLLQDHHFRSNDAPPLIPSTVAEPQPTAAKPQLPIAPTSSSPIEMLNDWRGAYRTKALNAKKSNDVQLALQCLRENKKIESALEKLVADSTTDLSAFDLVSPYESTLTAGQPTTNPPESIPELNPEEAQKLFNAPPAPTSILDALEQRLAKYEQTLKEAQGENNSGKVRRLGRIVKNYECAIKAYKQEKPYDYESLPTPPGFAEIPFAKNEAEPKQPEESNNKAATAPVASSSSTITVEREAAAAIKTRPTTKDPLPVNPKELQRATSTERKIRTTAEKQTNYLIERQRQFKLLALEAKQKGDIEKAKEYLRNAKGFDPLIEASRSGLPIDVSSIPTLPDSNDDFVIISQPKETNYVEINDDREEMFRKLEMELTSQITVCQTNREYFLKLGNSSSALMFENYAIEMKKDLAVIRNCWKRGDQVPKFRYEQKNFSIVETNPELASNHMQIEILSAIDLPFKGDPDTFVKFEFQFPKDTPQLGRTHTVKSSRNPEYKQTFTFEIERKSRSLVRSLKKGLRCEIVAKGGLFRSDQLLGTVNVSLSDLETKCQVFDSFPLTTGRKAIGGKLHIRVKLREPLLAKQIKEIRQKWLVLD